MQDHENVRSENDDLTKRVAKLEDEKAELLEERRCLYAITRQLQEQLWDAEYRLRCIQEIASEPLPWK